MKMPDLPPHDHNMDPTSSTMHHTVQAACMQVMSLTSHILAHGIAVTDRSSGGATNIVAWKGSVNECNQGVFCYNHGSITIDNTGIISVTEVQNAYIIIKNGSHTCMHVDWTYDSCIQGGLVRGRKVLARRSWSNWNIS